jgi:hypothetical protein
MVVWMQEGQAIELADRHVGPKGADEIGKARGGNHPLGPVPRRNAHLMDRSVLGKAGDEAGAHFGQKGAGDVGQLQPPERAVGSQHFRQGARKVVASRPPAAELQGQLLERAVGTDDFKEASQSSNSIAGASSDSFARLPRPGPTEMVTLLRAGWEKIHLANMEMPSSLKVCTPARAATTSSSRWGIVPSTHRRDAAPATKSHAWSSSDLTCSNTLGAGRDALDPGNRTPCQHTAFRVGDSGCGNSKKARSGPAGSPSRWWRM